MTDNPSTLAGAEPAREEQEMRAGRRGRFGAIRDAVVSFLGAVLAIVPHVMHHVGLIAGAAFLTGASGNTLLYVVGLVLSVPMLGRLRRRFTSWWAPAIAIVVFTAVFSLSAFVIGPAISGGPTTSNPSTPTDRSSQDSHPHDH